MNIELGTLLATLPTTTQVRIKVAGYSTKFAGRVRKGNVRIIDDIVLEVGKMPIVYAIYPLYHAQEIYIECF